MHKGLITNKIKMNTCSLLLFSSLILLTKLSYSQTVTIGNQVWMTKNLNVDTFRNGDKIPEAKTAEEWLAYGKAGKAAWCYYDNDTANGEKYGKLYNWFAVIDARDIAPRGWRVPNNNDWAALGSFLGGDSIAAPKLKSTNGWKKIDSVISGNGDNSSGFSALPSGFRDNSSQNFRRLGKMVGFWSSSTDRANGAYAVGLIYIRSSLGKDVMPMSTGLTIRCIKD
jgi:uncharacterized protein (TIGR02145 family)